MLEPQDAIVQTRQMIKWRNGEAQRLAKIHAYLRGSQALPVIPAGVPREVRRMAQMSRINIIKLIVNSLTQSLFVDGYRIGKQADDAPAWEVWQANRMDARQTAVHRAAVAYGISYVTVLPGDTGPVMKGFSPRRMTTVYGDDDDWPMWALECQTSPAAGCCVYRLFDDEAVYYVGETDSDDDGDLVHIDTQVHDLGITPVIRFRNELDVDDELCGEVEPIIPLQDQSDLTTFQLLVAQHYSAHRQRYILGWLADSEEEKLKASASRLWTFDEDPNEITVGEFSQTDLSGYLSSREATHRNATAVSQTPAHELIGQLVNLSADAIAAAEAGRNRKVAGVEVSFGESWEQALELAGQIGGFDTSSSAEVRWRDTEARSFAATVDALGKLAAMLGVPTQELWERIPGVTQEDVERWKATAQSADAFANLTSMLDKQMGAAPAKPAAAAA